MCGPFGLAGETAKKKGVTPMFGGLAGLALAKDRKKPSPLAPAATGNMQAI